MIVKKKNIFVKVPNVRLVFSIDVENFYASFKNLQKHKKLLLF